LHSRNTGRLVLVAGLAAVVVVSAPLALSAQEPPPDEFRYRIDVQLVLLSANVFSADGAPITTLEQEAFEVYEDGKPRPIKLFEKSTGLPLQLVLMIDSSLSAATELEAEKQALMRFIQQVLQKEDAASLYVLSGKPEPAVDFTAATVRLREGLKAIKVRGGTALYDAVVGVSEKLRGREGRRVMIVISDGNDTTSKEDFHAALRAAQEAEATIFALVVRPIPGESGRNVRGEHVLITLADLTGGRVFFADRVGELDRFFSELNGLLRTQYLLGYQPAPSKLRPEFREIEVRIKGADYNVQHRKGYYAEGRQ
jgi:Ca-activated chloride channel family protein